MTKVEKVVDYCKDCKFKNENFGINEPEFCLLGYTQNPKTLTATFNVAKNNGVFSICPTNPWRTKALIRLGLCDPTNPFENTGI